MQTYIIILFILSGLSLVLQMNISKTRLATIFALSGIGIFLYLIYPLAIEQSFSKFKELLRNKELMSQLMVIQIAESILGVLLSVFLIKQHYGEPVKRFFKPFKYFPGLVFIPALFYGESLLFLNVHGFDFKHLAMVVSIGLPLLLWLFKVGLNKLIPEYDLQLELKFILHILQLVIGIIVAILLFRLPTATSEYQIDIMQIVVLLACIVVVGGLGKLYYRYKIQKLSKHLLIQKK